MKRKKIKTEANGMKRKRERKSDDVRDKLFVIHDYVSREGTNGYPKIFQ